MCNICYGHIIDVFLEVKGQINDIGVHNPIHGGFDFKFFKNTILPYFDPFFETQHLRIIIVKLLGYMPMEKSWSCTFVNNFKIFVCCL
jgi:hypothetical protein